MAITRMDKLKEVERVLKSPYPTDFTHMKLGYLSLLDCCTNDKQKTLFKQKYYAWCVKNYAQLFSTFPGFSVDSLIEGIQIIPNRNATDMELNVRDIALDAISKIVGLDFNLDDEFHMQNEDIVSNIRSITNKMKPVYIDGIVREIMRCADDVLTALENSTGVKDFDNKKLNETVNKIVFDIEAKLYDAAYNLYASSDMKKGINEINGKINERLTEERNKGKSFSINDIMTLVNVEYMISPIIGSMSLDNLTENQKVFRSAVCDYEEHFDSIESLDKVLAITEVVLGSLIKQEGISEKLEIASRRLTIEKERLENKRIMKQVETVLADKDIRRISYRTNHQFVFSNDEVEKCRKMYGFSNNVVREQNSLFNALIIFDGIKNVEKLSLYAAIINWGLDTTVPIEILEDIDPAALELYMANANLKQLKAVEEGNVKLPVGAEGIDEYYGHIFDSLLLFKRNTEKRIAGNKRYKFKIRDFDGRYINVEKTISEIDEVLEKHPGVDLGDPLYNVGIPYFDSMDKRRQLVLEKRDLEKARLQRQAEIKLKAEEKAREEALKKYMDNFTSELTSELDGTFDEYSKFEEIDASCEEKNQTNINNLFSIKEQLLQLRDEALHLKSYIDDEAVLTRELDIDAMWDKHLADEKEEAEIRAFCEEDDARIAAEIRRKKQKEYAKELIEAGFVAFDSDKAEIALDEFRDSYSERVAKTGGGLSEEEKNALIDEYQARRELYHTIGYRCVLKYKNSLVGYLFDNGKYAIEALPSKIGKHAVWIIDYRESNKLLKLAGGKAAISANDEASIYGTKKIVHRGRWDETVKNYLYGCKEVEDREQFEEHVTDIFDKTAITTAKRKTKINKRKTK